ncbi:hypothetical protein GCM10027203_75440 [Nonomuraea fastidiosa]
MPRRSQGLAAGTRLVPCVRGHALYAGAEAAQPVTGTQPPALPPLPWGRQTPTTGPVAYPPPSGVPDTAVRMDVVNVGRPGIGWVRNGAYWFDVRAPHRLAGYSGGDLLTATEPAEDDAARLTATPGGDQEAKDTYAALAAERRRRPGLRPPHLLSPRPGGGVAAGAHGAGGEPARRGYGEYASCRRGADNAPPARITPPSVPGWRRAGRRWRG